MWIFSVKLKVVCARIAMVTILGKLSTLIKLLHSVGYVFYEHLVIHIEHALSQLGSFMLSDTVAWSESKIV